MITNESRAAEVAKYEHVYSVLPDYRMGDLRMQDARRDLIWAFDNGARSYLDIGCGRGEMLGHAATIGYHTIVGTEAVDDLCGRVNVECVPIHKLIATVPPCSYDMVTSFDVIEHLLPEDDEMLLIAMAIISSKCVALTANNMDSIDPTTNQQLHINKRPYDEWDEMIRDTFEDLYAVTRCEDKQYVSETWRCILK